MKEKLVFSLKQLLGMLFYSFGVAGIVVSVLGASPIDAATFYINELIPIFKNVNFIFTGQGLWLIIFNIIIALVLLVLTRNKNILFNILISVFIGLLFSVSFDLHLIIYKVSEIGDVLNIKIIYRIIAAVISINFMAFGIAYLAYEKLLGTPFDELALYLQSKVSKYYISKIILDGSFLVFAIILGFLFKDPLFQINVFTIVVLIGLGPLINLYINLLNKVNKNRKEYDNNEIK